MFIKVFCTHCQKELERSCALLIPPSKSKGMYDDNIMQQYFICDDCWEKLLHWLKTPTNQRNEPKTQQIKDFLNHLEQASKIVQSWPEWKQEILGGKSTPKYYNQTFCEIESMYGCHPTVISKTRQVKLLTTYDKYAMIQFADKRPEICDLSSLTEI